MSVGHFPDRGRIAALALLALLLAALWAGPVGMYFDFVADGADAIARQAQLLQRYRTLAETPAVTESADPAAAMRPDPGGGQAVALLQDTVNKAAAANHVEVRSVQMLRSEAVSEAVKVGVRVNALGDLAGVIGLLYVAETTKPVLYTDNLQIRPRLGADGKPSQIIEVQFDVSGVAMGSPR